jgi:septal ring factor EnvC (AmiA/AmiB activator)
LPLIIYSKIYYAFTTKHILDSKRIIIKGVYNLVKCPKCGVDVSTPVKTWPIPTRKPSKKGEESKIAVGIFECPNCNARFRAALEVETKIEETASIKNMVERIKGIKGELMQTLKNLRERIKTLETERANLMIEIDQLKKVAESKVNALESEVTMLREEVKSLRDLLGYTEEAGK